MPRQNAVWVNGRDLADFGVATARLEGPFAAPVQRFRTTPSPGRWGVRVLSAEPEGASRVLTLTGHVSATTPAGLDEVVRKVIGWCSRGLLEIVTGHNQQKVFYARALDPHADPVRRQFLREHAEFSLQFDSHDGLVWDALGSVARITQNNTPRQVRLKRAHVSGFFRIWGPFTDPLTITALDAARRARLVLTLATSATLSQYVLIDCLHGRFYRSTGGAALISEPNMVGATFDFPLYFDPLWGDVDRGIYPAFMVTGLTTGGGVEFLYRQTDT